MGEIGLAEGHQAGVEVAPNEEQQERNGGEVLVGDGVDDGEGEVDAERNFRVGHPAGFVAVFFGDESVFLAFDFEFRGTREIAFYAKDGFEYGFGVADGDADAGGHDEGHIEKSALPGFWVEFFLRDEVEAGNGTGGSEEKRQIDQQHLQPALIEANDHRGKQHRGEEHHQRVADVSGEMKEGFGFDVPWRVGTENLRQNFFCSLHQALGPARLLGLEAVHVDGKFAGAFDAGKIDKFPAF